MANCLVTGGSGYIGSHTCVELLAAGHRVLILDNLSNSKPEAVRRIARIAGTQPEFIRADVRDRAALDEVFARHRIDAVIHFAGLKAVGESVREPLRYYDHNVAGSRTLLDAMQQAGVKRIVFSSSATVYDPSQAPPWSEDFRIGPVNPYGRSKAMVEDMLADLHTADPEWSIARLRYFNPVGAHDSGLIGEDPVGIPNNLMPAIAQTVAGRLPCLSIYGDDYPTPDGTGVRDYIHVVDLAKGHVKALTAIDATGSFLTVNLGTGRGYSVLEMVRAFEAASGREVPRQRLPRRPGDAAAYWADARLAGELLDWKTEKDLADMCADVWRWQQKNPLGYAD